MKKTEHESMHFVLYVFHSDRLWFHGSEMGAVVIDVFARKQRHLDSSLNPNADESNEPPHKMFFISPPSFASGIPDLTRSTVRQMPGTRSISHLKCG